MEDIQQQLAALRRRIANIGVASESAPRRRAAEPPPRYPIEEFLSGEVVRTPLGEHFETERVWERHRRHGSIDISDLFELPEDLLEGLSEGGDPTRASHSSGRSSTPKPRVSPVAPGRMLF